MSTLQQSLRRQAKIFNDSIVLTPVDNFPDFERFEEGRWLHGLYASDKQRTDADLKASKIQFAGRARITRDLNFVHEQLAENMGAEFASLRLLSGLHAHIVLLMGLAPIGAKVALLPIEAGGHFATPDIIERLGMRPLFLPIDEAKLCVDGTAAQQLIESEQPDILFIDRSEGLKYETFEWVLNVDTPIKLFDSSQYAAQIMTGRYTNPFEWGFHLQVMTLHKSFPGPQKAAVVGNGSEIWQRVMEGVSRYVSSSHIENTYLAGMILGRTDYLENYAQQLIDLADALESVCLKHELPVVSASRVGEPSWQRTQHLWFRFDSQDDAYAAWRALEQNRVYVNYRMLPYNLGWGLRLGVTASVARGVTSDCADDLGELIAQILNDPTSKKHRHRTTEVARHIYDRSLGTAG